MNTININIRMDKKLKEEFDKFCTNAGLSMTTAMCLFAKKTVSEQKIPFEITADPFYSVANIKRLEKAAKDVENGKVTIHELIEDDNE